jgi:hypothetical protein
MRVMTIPRWYQTASVTVFTLVLLAVMMRYVAAQTADTLPRYGTVAAGSDSAAVVRAASDALQGRSSVEVPMRTTRYVREGRAVVVSLTPVAMPGIVWYHLGGTVRVHEDGRRVVVARE